MYVFKNVFLKYFFHFHKIKIRHCRIIGINYCGIGYIWVKIPNINTGPNTG